MKKVPKQNATPDWFPIRRKTNELLPPVVKKINVEEKNGGFERPRAHPLCQRSTPALLGVLPNADNGKTKKTEKLYLHAFFKGYTNSLERTIPLPGNESGCLLP